MIRGRVVRVLKGRDARTGRFIPIATARRRLSTTVVEPVPQRVPTRPRGRR